MENPHSPQSWKFQYSILSHNQHVKVKPCLARAISGQYCDWSVAFTPSLWRLRFKTIVSNSGCSFELFILRTCGQIIRIRRRRWHKEDKKFLAQSRWQIKWPWSAPPVLSRLTLGDCPGLSTTRWVTDWGREDMRVMIVWLHQFSSEINDGESIRIFRWKVCRLAISGMSVVREFRLWQHSMFRDENWSSKGACKSSCESSPLR